MNLDLAANEVLQHYPAPLQPRVLVSLGNCGGFSGARLWRGQSELGDVCLRAWPPGGHSQGSLEQIHTLMTRARQAALTFVPLVYATREGQTCLMHAGRLWELVSWQPGKADYAVSPSVERLQAACAALAQLHEAWTPASPAYGPCPALARRLAKASEWLAFASKGRPIPLTGEDLDPLTRQVRRAWPFLLRLMPTVSDRLVPWQQRSFSWQPCLCDVWHDHLLFSGHRLTGLIDYGSVKMDHVAVDLARLLGSLHGDYRQGWQIGLAAYREIRALSAEEEALAQTLDQTGVILGAATWLLWLHRDGRVFENRAAAARRLETLLDRIEQWR
jgi:Ser/Thr protein kinase RdoA (MazF antagonist)